MNHLSLSRSLFLRFLFPVLLFFFQISGYTQIPVEDPVKNVDQGLTEQLGKLVMDFQGDVGIYVRHLTTGRTTLSIQMSYILPLVWLRCQFWLPCLIK